LIYGWGILFGNYSLPPTELNSQYDAAQVK